MSPTGALQTPHPDEAAEGRPCLSLRVSGAGPDLVLLHGGTGSWTHWIRNIPALEAQYRILAFDLPGFGDSPSFPANLPEEDYFRWVADAILAACQGPIRLVGFSFGGSVAAGVAPMLGDRLVALSLAAPGSFGEPTRRDVTVKPIRPRAGVAIDPRENARHNLGQIMFADIASADAETIDLHLRNIDRSRFPSRRISWQDRLEKDLAGISCPIQMIWGLGDRMATPSVPARVERCRNFRPDIRFDLIEGAGHWVQYERADEYDAALLSFLASILDVDA